MFTKKELPDDVLYIIRQYSKPVFVYFREYNVALGLFDLPPVYKKKLKNKIVDPAVREQIKICVDAAEDYHKKYANNQSDKSVENENRMDHSNWWASISRDKFVAMLDDREYHMKGFSEWYYEEYIENSCYSDGESEYEWTALYSDTESNFGDSENEELENGRISI